jgi:hypothetical protein
MTSRAPLATAYAVVGRIMRAAAAPEVTPWLWTLAFGHHKDRTPTRDYGSTREAAMAQDVFAYELPDRPGKPGRGHPPIPSSIAGR